METIGSLYIIAYLVSGVFLIVSTRHLAFEDFSSSITWIMIVFSVVVFVLSCMGKLRPKKVFLVLSAYQLCLFVAGVVIGLNLVTEIRSQPVALEAVYRFYFEHSSWYFSLHWIALIVWLILAFYGLWAGLTKSKEANP